MPVEVGAGCESCSYTGLIRRSEESGGSGNREMEPCGKCSYSPGDLERAVETLKLLRDYGNGWTREADVAHLVETLLYLIEIAYTDTDNLRPVGDGERARALVEAWNAKGVQR